MGSRQRTNQKGAARCLFSSLQGDSFICKTSDVGGLFLREVDLKSRVLEEFAAPLVDRRHGESPRG